MELLSVNFHEMFLDNPDAAHFSFSFLPDAHAASHLPERVEKMMSPPLLRKVGKHYEIVCGFKCARSYRRYRCRQMPAIVYEHSELTDEQCLWMNLLEGEGAGRLSPVEQAIVLQKFSGIGYGTDRLVTEVAPCIGLPQSSTYVENLLEMLSLDQEILGGAHKNDFGVEQAFLLLTLKSEEALALFNLLKLCKTNLNETRELLPLILDTAALQETEPASFISAQMKRLLASEPDSPRKRLHILRESLKKSRYPTLSTAEAKFNEVINHLALGNKCRIDGPRYFEGEDITITIRASNYDQLREVVQKLLTSDGRKNIRMLFGILKGANLE